jgi:hypothetical protein
MCFGILIQGFNRQKSQEAGVSVLVFILFVPLSSISISSCFAPAQWASPPCKNLTPFFPRLLLWESNLTQIRRSNSSYKALTERHFSIGTEASKCRCVTIEAHKVEASICTITESTQGLFMFRASIHSLKIQQTALPIPNINEVHWFGWKAENLRDLKVGGQVGCQVGGRLSVQTSLEFSRARAWGEFKIREAACAKDHF